MLAKKVRVILTLLFVLALFCFYWFTDYWQSTPLPQNQHKLPPLQLSSQSPEFYNPYDRLDSRKVLLGGFHYHHITFKKRFDPVEMFRLYQKRGLNFINYSDYNQVTDSSKYNPFYIPTYEHGLTLWPRRSHHFSMIGVYNEKPLPLRYPFYQSPETLQKNILRLRRHVDFLVLNHPNHFKTWKAGDLHSIKQINAIEVLTPYGNSEDHWDSLLSKGQLIWGVSAPDIHDPYKRPWAARYLVINSKSRQPKHILDALKRGNYYLVWDKMWAYPVYLDSVTINEKGMVTFRFFDKLRELAIIGKGGKVLKEASYTNQIQIHKDQIDSYARVRGINSNFRILLNPIIKAKSFKEIDFLPPKPERIAPPPKSKAAVIFTNELSLEESFYLTTLFRGTLGSRLIFQPDAESYLPCSDLYHRFFGAPFPPSALDEISLAPIWFFVDFAEGQLSPHHLSTLQKQENKRTLLIHWQKESSSKSKLQEQFPSIPLITLKYADHQELNLMFIYLLKKLSRLPSGVVARDFLDWAASKEVNLIDSLNNLALPQLPLEKEKALDKLSLIFQKKFIQLRTRPAPENIKGRLKGGYFEFFGGLATFIHSASHLPSELLNSLMKMHFLSGSVAKPGAGFFCSSDNKNVGSHILTGALPKYLPFAYLPHNLKAMNKLAHFTQTDFGKWRNSAFETTKKIHKLFIVGDILKQKSEKQAVKIETFIKQLEKQGAAIHYFDRSSSKNSSIKLFLKEIPSATFTFSTPTEQSCTHIDEFRYVRKEKCQGYFSTLQALDKFIRPAESPLFAESEDLFQKITTLSEFSPADLFGAKNFKLNRAYWPIYKENQTLGLEHKYRYRYQQHIPYPPYGIGPGSLGMFYSYGENTQSKQKLLMEDYIIEKP